MDRSVITIRRSAICQISDIISDILSNVQRMDPRSHIVTSLRIQRLETGNLTK